MTLARCPPTTRTQWRLIDRALRIDPDHLLPTGKPRRAWTALDPDKTRLIVRRYAKDNMHELLIRLTNFREWLLANGWDGKVVP
jgi:hypothetical protein